MFRDLGCIQIDPISVVARTHLLVLRSRLGAFDLRALESLLWEERFLFEYWAHAASIVLTEDYPIHAAMMQKYRESPSAWFRENEELRAHIMSEIGEKGPLPSRFFEDRSRAGWESTGWTSGRNVSRMLDHLWTRGELMVAGRSGGQKLWDHAERCLPSWTLREALPEDEVTRRAAVKAIRALGVAQPAHIRQHFTRGRYPALPAVLADLEASGTVQQARIQADGAAWRGPWYVHVDDLPLLEHLDTDGWEPRTTLLSPFDNLICDRKRTELLFNFRYRIEIYVPAGKRKYGYYVLPILHEDRLIGRIDPMMDRKQGVLRVNAVYAEADTPDSPETARAVGGAIEDLATFLGAARIEYSDRVPPIWRANLR